MQNELSEMQRTYKRLYRHHKVQQTAIKARKKQIKLDSKANNSEEDKKWFKYVCILIR